MATLKPNTNYDTSTDYTHSLSEGSNFHIIKIPQIPWHVDSNLIMMIKKDTLHNDELLSLLAL